MKIDVYRDAVGDWRWRFSANNGRILADSGEGYAERPDCIGSLEIVTAGIAATGYLERPYPGDAWETDTADTVVQEIVLTVEHGEPGAAS